MKSAVSKGTSWASSSSGKPCSEMRCGAPAGWYDFQWPSLRPVLSVPPLPSEHVPKVGSQWPRAVVSFASLLPEELLPAWWPSDRCNPFVPLLLQGRADLCQHLSPHSLWCTHLAWFLYWTQPAYECCWKCEQMRSSPPNWPSLESGDGARSTGIGSTWPPPAPVFASSCWLIGLPSKVAEVIALQEAAEN